MYVYPVYEWPWRPERVIRSPGVGVIKACEPLYIRCWKQR